METTPRTLAEWQELAQKSARQAATVVQERLNRETPTDLRAAIAWRPSVDQLQAEIESSLQTGGLLAGVPFMVKDLFDVAGLPTTASSTFLPEVTGLPQADSPVVKHFKEAGLAFAGKVHLHEFAYGLTGENPHFGNGVNPRHPGRFSGGSSSGSAWVVGKGIVPIAIGTDTGGSLRVPAAYCRLISLRLTPNTWSMDGCFPLSRSFDTPGWFTQTAEDMRTSIKALLAPQIRGQEKLELLDLTGKAPVTHPATARAAQRLAAALGATRNSETEEAYFAGTEGSMKHFSVIQSREAYAAHASWFDSHKEHYDPAVWARIERARHWTPAEIEKAERGQASVQQLLNKLLEEWDALILPAAPTPAPRPEDLSQELRESTLAITAPPSLAYLPALTLSCADDDGLSTGVQIVFAKGRWQLALEMLDRYDEISRKGL